MSGDHEHPEQRICRACNATFKYPLRAGQASRFYCASCMELEPVVRNTFEQQNKRLKSLTATVEKLVRQLTERPGAPGPEGSGPR